MTTRIGRSRLISRFTFRPTKSLDPMLLGELVPLADRQDRDSFAVCRPNVRVLTGTEEVHLASGWARQADRRG